MGRRAKRRRDDVDRLLEALKDLPRAGCFAPHKVKYRSLKQAETAADNQWYADKRVLTPYGCGDHFHLTSRGYLGLNR